MSINKVFLLGNLGADPEIRYTQAQVPVCTFRIATSDRRKSNDGEWEEHTEWHSIVTFGKQAENCKQYLSKGKRALVEGKLQTNKWQDQDGKDRYKTEIIASNVQFMGGAKSDSPSIERSYVASTSTTPSYNTQISSDVSQSGNIPDIKAPVSFEDDDIPF